MKYVRCGIRFTDELTAVNTADVLMLCLPHMNVCLSAISNTDNNDCWLNMILLNQYSLIWH